jgi:beta-glucosidase
MVSSYEYLSTLLRLELNFSGFMVTDYQEIENLHTWHDVSSSQLDAVNLAISQTTIDMSMIPLDSSFSTYLTSLVNSGAINISRVDASVRRILTIKNTLGMFDDPIPALDDPLVSTVGQASDWALSLNASMEAVTLLKNSNGVLPLPSSSNLLLTGVGCNSLIDQTGGWAVHWQGMLNDSEVSAGFTVLQGVRATNEQAAVYGTSGAGFTGNIEYFVGPAQYAANLDGVNMTEALLLAAAADYLVMCVGEGTYAEKPGDINDLSLPQGQTDFVSEVRTV